MTFIKKLQSVLSGAFFKKRAVASISDFGERATHLYPNDSYFAHLSIYNFALQFTRRKSVIDAGSGSGYGAHYLAENDARDVLGVEISQKAVRFSKKHFKHPHLQFKQGDLAGLSQIADKKYNTIFSSNVLEHVGDIRNVLLELHSILRKDGTLVLGLPPIRSKYEFDINIWNEYHLQIWTPKQWHHILSKLFENVDVYLHQYNKQDTKINFSNTPEEVTITEKDFEFPRVNIRGLSSDVKTYTVIFVARNPKKLSKSDKFDFEIDYIDQSFSRSPLCRDINYEQEVAYTDVFADTDTHSAVLKGKVKLTQQFAALENKLIGVSICVDSSQDRLKGELTMELIETGKDKLIRQVTIDASEMHNHSWQTFFFKPVTNSKGKVYMFRITGKNSNLTVRTNEDYEAISFRSYYQTNRNF